MAKKNKINKTNAIRYLQDKAVEFKVHQVDVSDGVLDAVTMARKLGVEANCVYKTLVTRSNDGEVVLAIIPSYAHLNLKKLASSADKKSCSMLAQADLKKTVGYIHGACSPFAMKQDFLCFVDESITCLDRVFVSAGILGLQLELSPKVLIDVRGARLADLNL